MFSAILAVFVAFVATAQARLFSLTVDAKDALICSGEYSLELDRVHYDSAELHALFYVDDWVNAARMVASFHVRLSSLVSPVSLSSLAVFFFGLKNAMSICSQSRWPASSSQSKTFCHRLRGTL